MASEYKGDFGSRTQQYELSDREVTFIINALLDKAIATYNENRVYSDEFTHIATSLRKQQLR